MEATRVASGIRHHVFVYGTLKSGERNHNILNDANNGRSTLVGQARTIKKWPLVLLSAFELPCLLPCDGVGHEVCGEVYQMDARMLEVVDHLEWHPRLYVRSQEDIELLSQGGGRLKAWIYFVREFDRQLLSLPYLVNFTGKPGIEWPEFIGDNEETRRFIEATFPEIIRTGDTNEGQLSE
ncbi:putative gamma-glutamylcyclotransferase CG2811 [Dermacentor andersoni]|uniref:putative gamma-glutamylcyclotransferase CG2811 n=1 Tax=Dermacentor andersoni TaxID=34620 RepID=UPI002415D336|nr:putative gamma-glutamylcyclotransferase CG2811 [Dermacentor andersoni]